MSIKNNRPNRRARTRQGYYKPLNPMKYKGDPSKIIFRSSWEKMYMRYCDLSPSIVEWSSESIAIPYISPLDPIERNKPRKYYVDFQVVEKQEDGTLKKFLVEVKPKKDYLEKPVLEGRKTPKKIKNYKKAAETWIVNQAKFSAARQYAQMFNMEFKIVNEDTLGLSGKK
jgi:hypothetical protein